MAARNTVGCLAVLSGLSLASLVASSIVAQTDSSLLLRLVAAPIELMTPFGPPLLLMALFVLLRPHRPYWKLAARAGAALLLSATLLWVLAGYAFAGNFSMNGKDFAITAGLLIGGVLLASAGFWPDKKWRLAE